MYFSVISQVRGAVNLRVDASVASTNMISGPSAVNPSLGVSHTSGPSFDLIPQNTQEFTRGILDPIDMALFDYYWEQGRSRNMLLHLFIDKIVFTKPITIDNKPVRRVENLPPDDRSDNRMQQFQRVIGYLRKKGIHPGFVTEKQPVGPPLDKSEAIKLETLVNISQAGLTLESTEKGLQLFKPVVTRFTLCFLTPEPDDDPRSCPTSPTRVQNLPTIRTRVPVEKEAEEINGVNVKADTIMIFHLRSIQGILYYLGEIVRASETLNTSPVDIEVGPKPELKPLFRLVPQQQGPAAVEIVYQGERYVIPMPTYDSPMSTYDRYDSLSMDVISIVSELLALKQKGETLPRTGTTLITP